MTARICLSLIAALFSVGMRRSRRAGPQHAHRGGKGRRLEAAVRRQDRPPAGGTTRRPEIGAGWKVENGALTRADKGAGDIITTDKFAAFELPRIQHLQGRQQRPDVPRHGRGRRALAHRPGNPDPGQQGRPRPAEIRLALSALQARRRLDAAKPAGEWNQLRILITPEKCATWMNGKLYYEYVKGSEDWNAQGRQEQVRQDGTTSASRPAATSACKTTATWSASATSRSAQSRSRPVRTDVLVRPSLPLEGQAH